MRSRQLIRLILSAYQDTNEFGRVGKMDVVVVLLGEIAVQMHRVWRIWVAGAQ